MNTSGVSDGGDLSEIEVGGLQFDQDPKLNTQQIPSNLLKQARKDLENEQMQKKSAVRNMKPMTAPQIPVSLSPKNTACASNSKVDIPNRANSSSRDAGEVAARDCHKPIPAGKALKFYMDKMTEFEKGEVLDYN